MGVTSSLQNEPALTARFAADGWLALPLGVRDELQTLFASQTLDIAEPGAEFQVTDVIRKPDLPIRRLVAAGCSIDHCIVYYERGGIAHTWHVNAVRDV